MKPRHPQRVPEYLQHIVGAIDRARNYTSGMDFAAFERDTRTQDAVIRSIEIVGEAANKVRTADPDFAARHLNIPWDLMYGMRNRIVHDYFEVDLEVVWQTVQRDLPACANKSKRFYNPIRNAQNILRQLSLRGRAVRGGHRSHAADVSL